MVTKFLYIFVIIGFIFTINSFGQKPRKKSFRPEINDEVIVALRKKQAKSKTSRKKSSRRKSSKCMYPICGGKTSMVNKLKSFDEADALFGKRRKSSHDKYANQEVSYRTKSKRKKVRGVTHDPEFENWASRKRKPRKIRKQ